jgi:hypothetical protein
VFGEESEMLVKVLTRRNVLKLGLLKSFSARMGELACCVDCEVFRPQYRMDTRWSSRLVPLSVETLVRVPFASLLSPASSPSPPVVQRLLRCRASRGGKVKVTSIVSC